MKKKISILFVGIGFSAALFLFALPIANAKMLPDGGCGHKSLAQKDNGAYCCAETELGSCSSSPDC